jgi:hypothetical protein
LLRKVDQKRKKIVRRREGEREEPKETGGGERGEGSREGRNESK